MKATPKLRLTAIVFTVCVAAPAQIPIDPQQVDAARAAFDKARRGEHLRCDFHPLSPALTYALEFQTGFTADVPLKQFGAPAAISVLLRVTPESGEPTYLATSAFIPEVVTGKVDAEFPARFAVGEGVYNVEALLKDDASRTCSSQFRIQAKRSVIEHGLKIAIPPGAVQADAALTPPPSQTTATRQIERLTILVHAAASNPRASQMDPAMVHNLVDSLSSLLRQLPAQSVRVVVFCLDKQAVLFDNQSFTAGDLGDVSDALEHLQLAVVDLKTLQNRDKADVFSDLVTKELHKPKPSTAVILIGPRSAGSTDASLEADPRGVPWFYLEYQTYPPVQSGPVRPDGAADSPAAVGRGGAGRNAAALGPPPRLAVIPHPDGIEPLIHRMNGAILPVRSPRDLADAIHRMTSEIPTVRTDAVVRRPDTPPPAAEPAPPDPPRTKAAELTESTGLAEPTGDEDPVEVLAHLRDRVLDHDGDVPNHTCVETVQRDLYQPIGSHSSKSCDDIVAASRLHPFARRLDLTDWLRLDVGMADGREIYSWAGAPRFAEGEIDELIPEGAFGSGPFAAMLLALFDNRDPHFTFDGEMSLADRRLLQYSFRVPRDESNYRAKAGREWVVTGYTGTLQVDPKTSDLVRFLVRTEELPPATHTCEVDTTLEYNMVSLAGFEYMLPKSARQRFIAQDAEQAENTMSFSACREFLGESSLSFGKREPDATTAPGAPRPTLPIGATFNIELTTGFTLGEAAAGDRIEGRLTAAVRDPQTQKVLAPAGAKVAGRLTRVELKHSSSGDYTVALRWESLQIAGAKVALNLKPDRQTGGLKAVARGVLLQRGTSIELPRTGEERDAIYHFPAGDTRVEGGLKTGWVTTGEHY